MRASLKLIIAALALAGTAPPLVAQTPPAPIVKVEGLRQISAHVHVIPDNSVPGGAQRRLHHRRSRRACDRHGTGPPNGAAVYEVAKKLAGTKPLYLVTTHVHPEHDLGAQAFPATTTLIRSTDQVKDIAEFGLQLAKVFASRSAINAELLKDADFRKADVTFEGHYDLDLGGVQVQAHGHGCRTIRPAIRSSGSSPIASCLPAISPCALSRLLRARIRAFGDGSRASTGWRRSSPPSSCRATARLARAPASSPAIAPI